MEAKTQFSTFACHLDDGPLHPYPVYQGRVSTLTCTGSLSEQERSVRISTIPFRRSRIDRAVVLTPHFT